MSLADVAAQAGIPEAAVNITAEFEGCLRKIKGQDLYEPYLCPANVPTLGLGTTAYNDRGGIPVKLSDPPVSRARCEEMLAYDLGKKYAPAVRRAVGPHLRTANQYAACISFTYNVGTGGFAKSTLAWLIKQGEYDRAANEFLRWNRGGGRVLRGLVRRRAAERELFLRPGPAYINSTAPPPPAPTPAPVAQPARSWWSRLAFWRK